MTPEISAEIDKAFSEAGAIYDTAGPKDRLSSLIAQAIRQAENEAYDRALSAVDDVAMRYSNKHDRTGKETMLSAFLAARLCLHAIRIYRDDPSLPIRSLATKDP